MDGWKGREGVVCDAREEGRRNYNEWCARGKARDKKGDRGWQERRGGRLGRNGGKSRVGTGVKRLEAVATAAAAAAAVVAMAEATEG